MSVPCTFAGCNKSFSSRFCMRRHRAIHEDKQFACPDCDKRFSLAQYLKEHALTHTGERPFKCTVDGCGKSFRQAGKLSIHMKKHRTSSLKARRRNKVTTIPKPMLPNPKKHKLDEDLDDDVVPSSSAFSSKAGDHSASFGLPSRKRQALEALTPSVQLPSYLRDKPRSPDIQSMELMAERTLPLPVQLRNSYFYSDYLSSLSDISPQLSAHSSPSLSPQLNMSLGTFGHSPVSPFTYDVAYKMASSAFAMSSMSSAASALATVLSAESPAHMRKGENTPGASKSHQRPSAALVQQVRQNMLADFHRMSQRVPDINYFPSLASSYQSSTNPTRTAAYLTQLSDLTVPSISRAAFN